MGREGRGWLNAVGWRPGRCFEGCTSRGGLVRWSGVVRGTHSSGLIAQGWAEPRRGRGSDSPVAIASSLTRFLQTTKKPQLRLFGACYCYCEPSILVWVAVRVFLLLSVLCFYFYSASDSGSPWLSEPKTRRGVVIFIVAPLWPDPFVIFIEWAGHALCL